MTACPRLLQLTVVLVSVPQTLLRDASLMPLTVQQTALTPHPENFIVAIALNDRCDRRHRRILRPPLAARSKGDRTCDRRNGMADSADIDEDDDDDEDYRSIFDFSRKHARDWPHSFARCEEAHQQILIDLDAYVPHFRYIDRELVCVYEHRDAVNP